MNSEMTPMMTPLSFRSGNSDENQRLRMKIQELTSELQRKDYENQADVTFMILERELSNPRIYTE